MSEPFLAEIRMVGFNFAPTGWLLCNGQLLAISQYQALFSLLGTTYGGDGRENFALPNLQSRVPVHPGPSVVASIGATGGVESVALTTQQIPAHKHLVGSANQATSAVPTGNVFAAKPRRGVDVYAPAPANTAINSQDSVGANQPHNNVQPYLTLNFIIAFEGIYPSRG
jgi:microcystin-dependent protein